MKSITLITPPSSFLLDERVFVSLGILKVAAVLREAGHPINFLDLSGVSNYLEFLEHYLSANQDSMVGITTTTPQLPAAISIAKVVRKMWPDARIILGGPHVTLTLSAFKLEQKGNVSGGRAYRAKMQLESLVDVLCPGDGELAVLQAVGPNPPAIVDGDDPDTGLFMDDAFYDASPYPARELVDMSSYHYTIDGHEATSLIAQLGCPFTCGFCGGRNSKALRVIRKRSTASVVNEIESLYKTYGYTGFMCYDENTEILTAGKGFVRFPELSPEDQVAILDPKTNELRFEKPKRIIKKDFNGDLVTVKTRFTDLAVTPEHRVWVNKSGRGYDHITAAEMISSPEKMTFSQHAEWKGQEVKYFTIPAYETAYLGRNLGSPKVQVGERRLPVKIWVQFMAWYLSEGSCYRPKVRNGRGYRTLIKQSLKANPEKVAEIKAVLDVLGYRYSYSSDQFHIDSKELYEYLKQFGHSKEKYVPQEFKDMSSDLILLFLKTYIRGDGHTTANQQEVLTSFSDQMRNDLQEMAIKAGYWAYNDDKYKRVLLRRQRDVVINGPDSGKDVFGKQKYEGTVHCVTVSTGVILVRRNGQATWSGNCYDDELNVNPNLVELMNGISDLQERLGVDFRLRGFVKSELFNEEQARAMYRAGFRWILCGYESADPRILKNIKKRATREDNTRCVELAKNAGLKVKALMSVGHPGESVESITAVRDWLLEVQPEEFDCTVITTYPGTPYYDEAVLSPELSTPQQQVFTYTQPQTGDRLHSWDVDYTRTSDYYKGDPEGGYKAFVFTDTLSSEEIVNLRNWVEEDVRDKLNITFNPGRAALRYEHSMGQGFPDFILRQSKE